MRPQGASVERFPGTVEHNAFGLCRTCYAQDKRERERDLPRGARAGAKRRVRRQGGLPRIQGGLPADYAFLRTHDDDVELVRWTSTKVGPVDELVTGRFAGCTSDAWELQINGAVVAFPREVWEVCLP